MKTIYYRITLEEPCLFTMLDGDPNSAVSYDFIPGAVLRGMVIGMVMREYNLKELDLTNNLTRRLFFSDNTRFLNAYPVIQDKRSLPVPISWRRAKYDNTNIIYDEALHPLPSPGKYSSVNGFATTDDKDIAYIYHPQRVLNVHTQRARKNATEQEVYRYDALAPQQTFEAMIYCQDNDVDLLTSLLKDKYKDKYTHIGGARSAGYGKARIQVANTADDGWIPEVKPQSTNKTNTIITLLSDVILRDENGQYSPTLSALASAIGLDKSLLNTRNSAIQTTFIGGFNRKWGLPLPQTPALKRGSVIVLNSVTIDQEHLNHLLVHGIGERRNEGFGQIAVNWQQSPKLTLYQADDQKKVKTPLEPQENPFEPQSDAGIVWEIFKKHFDKMKVGDKKDEQSETK